MEKIKNEKIFILKKLYSKQNKYINFDEFEAEINYILYQYQHYIFELKSQIIKNSRKEKIIEFLKNVELNYSEILNHYNINGNFLLYNNKFGLIKEKFKLLF